MTGQAHSEKQRLLSSLLIEARKEAGLTQAAVAQMLGRGQAYVSKYESGRKSLDVIEFLEIAKVIGFDPLQIIRELI